MPAIVLVMRKKEGCNKMSKKTHFVTAPFRRQAARFEIDSILSRGQAPVYICIIDEQV